MNRTKISKTNHLTATYINPKQALRYLKKLYGVTSFLENPMIACIILNFNSY